MNPDDPQFTAYAINALPASERNEFEDEIWSDSALLGECMEMAAFAEKLKRALSIELNAGLTETHWREIHAEAAIVGLPTNRTDAPSLRNRFPFWAFPAAAGVVFGAVIASLALTWGDKTRAVTSEETSPLIDASPALSVPETPRTRQPIASGLQAVATTPKSGSGAAPESSTPEIPPVKVALGSAIEQPIFSSSGTLQISSEVPPNLPKFDFIESAGNSNPEIQTLSVAEPVSQGIISRESASLNYTSSPMTPLPAVYFIPSPSSLPNGNVQPPVVSVPPILSATQQAGTGGRGTKPNVTEKKNGTVDTNKMVSSTSTQIAWRRTDESFAFSAAGTKDRVGVSSSDILLAPMRLDTELYPTLEYLNVILEREEDDELAMAESSSSNEATVEQFHFRDAPDVKVLVMLQSNGLPSSMMMGNTKVISISDPFVVKP